MILRLRELGLHTRQSFFHDHFRLTDKFGILGKKEENLDFKKFDESSIEEFINNCPSKGTNRLKIENSEMKPMIV